MWLSHFYTQKPGAGRSRLVSDYCWLYCPNKEICGLRLTRHDVTMSMPTVKIDSFRFHLAAAQAGGVVLPYKVKIGLLLEQATPEYTYTHHTQIWGECKLQAFFFQHTIQIYTYSIKIQ